MSQTPVIYLAVLRGQEQAARRTLGDIAARSVLGAETVLLRIGTDEPAGTPDSGPLRVVDVAPDPRGALYQAVQMAAAGAHDALVVRPGAELPPAWDARLRLAAYAGPRVGTAAPLTLESLKIGSDDVPGQADFRAVDRCVYGRSLATNLQTDGCQAACLYLRHDALAAVASDVAGYHGADFASYLADRVRGRGYCHAVADHVFVGGAVSPARSARADLPHSLLPLAQVVREALAGRVESRPIPGVEGPRVQLHLVHRWGGGVCRWVQNYSRADPERLNLVLRPFGTAGCFGEGLALYRHLNDFEPLRHWRLDPPIPFTSIAHLQYRAILDEVIDDYGVDSVLVSSFIGHSLDALRLDVPTLLVSHDYYPFCPALNIHFHGVCAECDRERLARCLGENPCTQLFRRAEPEAWAELRERFAELVVARKLPIVVPSASVARASQRLEPRLPADAFHVLAHGLDAHDFQSVTPPGDREKLHGVVLGRLNPPKGAELLAEALDGILPHCELTLLGCGDQGARFAGVPGVRVVKRYDASELPRLLAELAPDFGLLPSIVPETFSYTLSELSCAGVPPVATNLGSFADRIEHGRTGFLFAPRPEDLVRTVAALHGDRRSLDAVRANLAGRAHRSLGEMLADYDRLLPAPAFCARRYTAGRNGAASPLREPETVLGQSLGEPLDWIIAEETFEAILDRVYEVFRRKLAHTPRLKNWQRPLVQWIVARGYGLVKLSQRWGRRNPPERKAA